jgi:hypothetical protein
MLSESTLDAMRRLHDSALFDTCVRMVYAAGTGDYGYGSPTYTAGATLSCLVTTITQDEALGSTQVRAGDVNIRLPRGTTLDHKDRLKVTHLHGDALPVAQTYEIVAGPQTLHTGVMVIGRLVTDGSDE